MTENAWWTKKFLRHAEKMIADIFKVTITDEFDSEET